MIVGIILAIVFILLCCEGFTRFFSGKKIKTSLVKWHKVLGIGFVLGTAIHMILTIPLFKQRPLVMYLLGVLMLLCGIVSFGVYRARKRLGAKWITIHKIMALTIGICLIGHVYLCVSSFMQYSSQVAQIQVNQLDMSGILDGEYVGECNVGYIYAKVQVSVESGEIEEILLLEHRNERGTRAESVISEMMNLQSVKVDAVSGATNSSKVIMKAVENALVGR